MSYSPEIRGEIAQTAHFSLSRGDTLWASRGALVSYGTQVQWSLKVPGGLSGALRRSFAGEGVALTFIESAADGQSLVLGANQPGHITTWDLAQGPVLTTRGAFLAAWGNIDINVSVAKRAGAALFGGAGLFLQKISGQGTVLVHGSGDFSQETLAKGETRLVSTGNLAAFGDGVDYDIQAVGGLRKSLFGSEGLFMTRLTGPGTVLMQTLKRTHTGGGGRR